MLRLFIPIMCLAAASCAATPEQIAQEEASATRTQERLDRAPTGLQPQSPVSCFNPRNMNITIFGDQILYSQGRGRAVLARTNGGCFGLRREDIVITQTPTGQLCRGDIVRTVDRTSRFPSGSCAFSDLVPYTRAPRG